MFELESSSLGVNIFGHHAVLKHMWLLKRCLFFERVHDREIVFCAGDGVGSEVFLRLKWSPTEW